MDPGPRLKAVLASNTSANQRMPPTISPTPSRIAQRRTRGPSLVPKRVDGIHPRRLASREKAKPDPDCRGKRERDHYDLRQHAERKPQRASAQVRSAES